MFDWLCGARPGAVTASGLHTSYAGLLGGAKLEHRNDASIDLLMLNDHEFIMPWRKFMVTFVTTSLIWCLLIGIAQTRLEISKDV
mgnify:FL=1